MSSIADAGPDEDAMLDGRTRVLHAETLPMHSRSMPQWLLHAITILLLLRLLLLVLVFYAYAYT